MAFTIDTSTQGTYGTSDPHDTTHTCAANADLLVLRIFINGTTARTGGAPTYNSQALTDSGQGFVFFSGGECGVEVWFLIDPPTGSAYTLSIPNTGAAGLDASITSYFAGSGYTAAKDNANNATGETQNPSLTLNVLTNNCLIDAALGSGDRDAPTAGTNFTLVHTYDAGNQTWGSERWLDAGTSGNKTVAFATARADDWGLIGISFKEVASATNINCTLGSVTVTGLNATVQQGTTVSCTLGTVTVTGLQADPQQGTSVFCTLGAVTVTGLNATVQQGTTVSCSLGTVTVTGLNATIQATTTIGCTLGAVTVTGLQATVSNVPPVDCTLGTVTVTGLNATVQQGTTVSCTLGAVTVTGLQAEVQQGTTIACALGTTTVTGLQATIQQTTTINCILGSVTVTGLAATVTNTPDIECSLGTVTVTGLQAAVQQGTTISCTLGTVTATGLQATVQQGTTISCTLGSVTVTGLQAAVSNAAPVDVPGIGIRLLLPIWAAQPPEPDTWVVATADCTLGTVTVSGLPATVSQEITIDCTLGAITAMAFRAAVDNVYFEFAECTITTARTMDCAIATTGTMDCAITITA